MTYDNLPTRVNDEQSIEATEIAIRQRNVKRILAENDAGDVLAAARVLSSLPRHVKRGEQIEWETLDERTRRVIGEVGVRE